MSCPTQAAAKEKEEGVSVSRSFFSWHFLSLIYGKKYVSGLVELDGWQDWKKVTIDNIKCTKGDVKIGVYVDHAADGWGMIDDFYFGQE